MTTLMWFRNDLRLSDNPALHAAIHESNNVIPLYILDDTVERPLGGASRWWLHHSLASLQADLKKRGLDLLLRHGETTAILSEVIDKYQVDAIFWNRTYETTTTERDTQLKADLKQQGLEVHSCNGTLLIEPSRVLNKTGGWYKVYTPFSKIIPEWIPPYQRYPIPSQIPQTSKIQSDKLSDWQLLPTHPDWSQGFDWQVGEAAAKRKLASFIEDNIKDYSDLRNRPDLPGTSQMSPHIHFGEISVHRMWYQIKEATEMNPKIDKGTYGYLRQLIWRDFSYYLCYHYPTFYKQNFRPEFNSFKWSKSKKLLKAWQTGQTGYPIVDAGMRELYATGYMHNRVRMITASFLTKDLLIDWREGEAWFWDTLCDADLANNSAGWQWVAGCGADAAPYFRIFNPTLQGQKFDPEGNYVRHWVPEIEKLPNKYLHCPSEAPESVLKEAGIKLGIEYPKPIVDHKQARDEALVRYKALK